MQGDRTRDERELEIALPLRTRRHFFKELQRHPDESLSGYSDSRFRVGIPRPYERVIEEPDQSCPNVPLALPTSHATATPAARHTGPRIVIGTISVLGRVRQRAHGQEVAVPKVAIALERRRRRGSQDLGTLPPPCLRDGPSACHQSARLTGVTLAPVHFCLPSAHVAKQNRHSRTSTEIQCAQRCARPPDSSEGKGTS